MSERISELIPERTPELKPHGVFRNCQQNFSQYLLHLQKLNENDFQMNINNLEWDDVSELAYYSELLEQLVQHIEN